MALLSSRSAGPRPPAPPPWRGAPDLGGLRPYQADGVLWLRSRQSALLADEMRLGKTAQILRAMEPPAIVLCPAGVKGVWADEARRWRPDLRVSVGGPGELALPAGPRALAVSGYGGLPVPEERARGAWLVPYDLRGVTLVLDEAHLLKDASAKRTERARLLALQCGRVWGATGTPLAGRPADLWGVLRTCRLAREAFGSFDHFAQMFGGRIRVLPGNRNWTVVPGHCRDGESRCASCGREILEVHADGCATRRRTVRFWEWPDAPPSPAALAAFSRVALRRLRRDVAPDLPPRAYRDVPHSLEAELACELDRAEWPEDAELPPPASFFATRARVAASRIPLLLELVAPFEETWGRNVPEGERLPLVVFSAHREPVLALRGREGWACVTGETSPEDRRVLCDAFRAGLVRGFAATIGAAGVGVDLSAASHALFADRSFSPADNVQAEDRLVSVGRPRPISVDRIVSDHPLDLRVQAILDEKQARIAAAVRA